MSLSGIGVSPELTEVFSQAVDSPHIRFIKVSINKDPLKLIPDGSVAVTGSLQHDLKKQDEDNVLGLEENVPAYILVRDEQPNNNGWLAMYYMPESNVAQFDRMVYSTTRNTLTKSLGASAFTGSPEVSSRTTFLSSYTDYINAQTHTAPPMNAMEREMAEIRAAEREAGVGSSARKNHLGKGVGVGWNGEVEEAVRGLGEGGGSRLVIMSIDTATETLILKSVEDIGTDQVGTALPATEPCYAFFAWPEASNTPPTRQIIFIYSCPSSSPVKHRMIYSSAARGVYASATSILSPTSTSPLASRKIETSDPKEIDEAFLRAELGVGGGAGTGASTPGSGARTPNLNLGNEEKKPFARPKGPGRKR